MGNVSPIRSPEGIGTRTPEYREHLAGCRLFLAAGRLTELEGGGARGLDGAIDLAQKCGLTELEIAEVLFYSARRCRRLTGRTYRRGLWRGAWNCQVRGRRLLARGLRRAGALIEPGPHDEWMTL